MVAWLRKFVINRLLYMLLLVILCLGIFPLRTLFPFTMRIGRTLDKFSPGLNLALRIDKGLGHYRETV